jgi:hypothetical protein
MKYKSHLTTFLLLLLVSAVLAACTDDSAGRNDPVVEAARNACRTQSGVDYDCVEQAAIAALNPDICRLVGISIDDMCLQAVYKAVNDPSICDRIYLQGVVPNCRAYYAQFTPATTPPIGTSEKPALTQTPFPSYTHPPTATPTSQPTLTPSPTPLFVFDLSGYDPDLFHPIDLHHRPPLIAKADETVLLMFDVVNTIGCPDVPRICRLEPTLFYAYGNAEAFQRMPLTREIINEMETLVARLPATDQAGRSLRYYAEFAVPEAGYTLRYPVEGTIEMFATTNFISIELPPAKAVEPSDKVYNFFWGYGPDKVRRGLDQAGQYIIAPPAMDVAQDGRIALMDPVNERIIIYNPSEESYASAPLPFYYNLNADLAFDTDGQLVICDWAGEYVEGTPSIPYCYRLLPDGKVEVAAPVYVKFPSKITKDLNVLDQFDYRLVAPFNSQGDANSREAQRKKETWNLPYRFVEGEQGFDMYTARFADLKEEVAFEVHSAAGFSGLVDFAKTPQGYLMVFGGGEQIRAVWVDPSGVILKDGTLQRGNDTEFSLYGQVAVAQDGSLYVLGSTERGIEIHFIKAP